MVRFWGLPKGAFWLDWDHATAVGPKVGIERFAAFRKKKPKGESNAQFVAFPRQYPMWGNPEKVHKGGIGTWFLDDERRIMGAGVYYDDAKQALEHVDAGPGGGIMCWQFRPGRWLEADDLQALIDNEKVKQDNQPWRRRPRKGGGSS